MEDIIKSAKDAPVEMLRELSANKGEDMPMTRAMSTVNAAYTDSPMVTYTCLSPNCNSPRNHAIDTITIHEVWGQCSVEALGDIFLPESRQASSNYGVGFDGRIGMYVHERDRAWTSGSSANDNRAVTIEVANDRTYPNAVNATAYAALITLCADICKRNGKSKMVWCGSLAATNARTFAPNEMRMTLHKWFQDTDCPGPWLSDHMQEIADKVNAILAPRVYPKIPFAVKVLIDDLNLRKGPGTNYKDIGLAPKGNVIVDKRDGDWGYIGKGWIYLGNDNYTKIGGHLEVSPFKDVDINDPAYKYIKACYDAGIMMGYSDGKFRPKKKVTRQQLATVIAKLLEKK